ncbi:MAG TPA: NUDIX domain-containing protein [Micromonosporaceae bacterium]|jgi:ADP-ribose pyrophosphatase YjhB (NUDIX family)
MTPRQRIRVLAYRLAYALPGRVRRRLVRIAMPKYIAGAVVLVRDADARDAGDGPGRILLQRQPPGHGWSIPGGLLERGERPAVGAARELFEEAGVRVEPADLTAMNPNVLVHSDGRWIDCVFEAYVPADTPFVVDGGEVLEAAWFRLDALPPLTVPTARLLAHYGIGPYVAYPETHED